MESTIDLSHNRTINMNDLNHGDHLIVTDANSFDSRKSIHGHLINNMNEKSANDTETEHHIAMSNSQIHANPNEQIIDDNVEKMNGLQNFENPILCEQGGSSIEKFPYDKINSENLVVQNIDSYSKLRENANSSEKDAGTSINEDNLIAMNKMQGDSDESDSEDDDNLNKDKNGLRRHNKKVIRDQGRELVSRVHNYFLLEKANRRPLISVQKAVKRTADALGIGVSTVTRILKEEKKSIETYGKPVFKTPGLTRKRKKSEVKKKAKVPKKIVKKNIAKPKVKERVQKPTPDAPVPICCPEPLPQQTMPDMRMVSRPHLIPPQPQPPAVCTMPSHPMPIIQHHPGHPTTSLMQTYTTATNNAPTSEVPWWVANTTYQGF